MYRHSLANARPDMPAEMWLALNADKIGYLTADMNDLERAGIELLPATLKIANEFGTHHRERASTLMGELFLESYEMGKVSFSESPAAKRFKEFRTQMYQEYNRVPYDRAERTLDILWRGFEKLEGYSPLHSIALLTDENAIRLAEKWLSKAPHPGDVRALDMLGEFAPHILDGSIDFCTIDFK